MEGKQKQGTSDELYVLANIVPIDYVSPVYPPWDLKLETITIVKH